MFDMFDSIAYDLFLLHNSDENIYDEAACEEILNLIHICKGADHKLNSKSKIEINEFGTREWFIFKDDSFVQVQINNNENFKDVTKYVCIGKFDKKRTRIMCIFSSDKTKN